MRHIGRIATRACTVSFFRKVPAMIPLLVFYIHVVFVAGYFTRRYQEEGLGEGLLAVFFSGLIFFVGWSMTSFIIRLVVPEQPDLLVNRDSASLLLLTCLEGIFYYFYFRGDGERGSQETVSEEQS